MDDFDPVVPVCLGLDLGRVGRRLRPVSVGRAVKLCRDERETSVRAGRPTVQARIFDVIRREIEQGGRPWIKPRELDLLMGCEVQLPTLYKSLQYLRKKGAIEYVPGCRPAVRLAAKAPRHISDLRGRTPGSARGRKHGGFARDW